VKAEALTGYAAGPLQALRPQDMVPATIGRTIADHAPAQVAGLLVCRVNGEWLLRESWASPVLPGDVIEWHEVPQDRDVLRGVLSIAAIALLGPYGLGLQGAALIAANFAAQLAINALLPPVGPEVAPRPQQTSQAFSTSLSGNEARLDQPIWKVCGHREITPPYAAQPYLEYLPRDGEADENLDREQYFYALFSVGIGDHDVVAKIGNTPLTRFADIVVADYLPPGTQPSQVLANVTTAVEVSGQVLESGRYSPGVAACAPGRTCASIGVDVAATRGLGKTGALTVTWRVETREINDFGQVLSAWSTVANESRTAFTATPQRWSSTYDLATAARIEVRVVRTDVQDTDPSALHEIAWIGLRAYLAEPAPLNPDAAHYEVVLRASSQLSQQASRDVRLICQAHVRSLNSSLVWQAAAFSRNWVWWCLDLIVSTTWGMGWPEDRVDLQSFYDEAVKAAARQDRFDYVFDQTLNAWDAAQLIARAGRCRVFRRQGVISIARDEAADSWVTAFTHRNCQGGISISTKLRDSNSPDAVIVEYQDRRTWEWTEILCPLPGVSETDVANPVYKRLEGIIGAFHAEREGRYEAANLLYRPSTVSARSEMQGMLPAYLSPVKVVPDIAGYGQAGDVIDWDPATLVMTLSERPDFSAGPLYLTLIDDEGVLADPIAAGPGPTVNDVTLASAPTFVLVLDDGSRERPKYLLGTVTGEAELCKVTVVRDGGLDEDGVQMFELVAVIDDERVHTADNDLLPSPDDDQDPVALPDDSEDVDGVDVLVVPRITDRDVYATSTETSYSSDLVARVTFQNNGKLRVFADGQFSDADFFASGEWNLYGEIETTDAALYDIRATLLTSSDGGSPVTFTGTVGSWLNLATSRVWELTTGFVDAGTTRTAIRILRFEIRETSTGIVQDSGVIDMRTFVDASTGG